MKNLNLTAHDIFFLARMAHNTLDPLFKAARQYEPSVFPRIEMDFGGTDGPYHGYHHITIVSHWKREGMFLQSVALTSKDDIDKVAAKVQVFIDAEQAKIEAEHDAAALYAIEEDTEAEARDWELQQERIRERADIERDEDAHDIELQNEYAGN